MDAKRLNQTILTALMAHRGMLFELHAEAHGSVKHTYAEDLAANLEAIAHINQQMKTPERLERTRVTGGN